MGYRVERSDGVVRVYFDREDASLADLPDEVLRELAGQDGAIVLVFPDRRVYVRPEDVRSLLSGREA